MLDGLLALPFLAIDAHVEQRALDVQRQLAQAGHHRLPPVDPLIVALRRLPGHHRCSGQR